jgi:predicted nucleic acid-binding protein
VIHLVLDASVVAKWYPPYDQEPLALQAHALLNRWGIGGIDLAAPDLIWVEIANILWKSVRSKRCSLRDAKLTLAALRQQGLPVVPAAPFVEPALDIAIHHGRTAYDSLYVALAVASNSELITADEKLVNALAAYFPVKWLGAI